MRVDKTYPIYRPCTQRGGGIRRGLVGKLSYLLFVYPLPKSCCSDPIPEGTCCVFKRFGSFWCRWIQNIASEVFIIVLTLSPRNQRFWILLCISLTYREWADVRWSENFTWSFSSDEANKTDIVNLWYLQNQINLDFPSKGNVLSIFPERGVTINDEKAVSYTHLTLPTICSV